MKLARKIRLISLATIPLIALSLLCNFYVAKAFSSRSDSFSLLFTFGLILSIFGIAGAVTLVMYSIVNKSVRERSNFSKALFSRYLITTIVISSIFLAAGIVFYAAFAKNFDPATFIVVFLMPPASFILSFLFIFSLNIEDGWIYESKSQDQKGHLRQVS